MLTRRLVTIVWLTAILIIPSMTSVGAAVPRSPPPKPTLGGGKDGQSATVTGSLQEAGQPVQAGNGKSGVPQRGSGNDDGTATSDPCWYVVLPAKAGDPRLGGDDPSTGVLYIPWCPEAINVNTGKVVVQPGEVMWARNGVAPVAPPPDPAAIAQHVADQMTAPAPVINLGPDPTQLAVKVPIWLSVTNQPPITFTLTVRGLSVTVTATLTSTTWSMGEPRDPANPASKVPAFTCTGTGTPPPAHPDRSTTPPCGYTYTWKSLADRTNGTGSWPITATTNWTVTWTATNGTGATLAQPLTPTTTQQAVIGEWRSTLIAGPGG